MLKSLKNFLIKSLPGFFSAALLLQAQTGAQLLNPGFENWTDCTPDNWATPNVCGFLTPVTKSTTSHSGSFAVRGEVVDLFQAKVQPFIQSGSDAEGFAITERYTAVQGYYMFAPIGGDRFGVNVAVSRNGNTIGQGASAIPTAAPSYTQFNIPITYTSPDVPDKVIIQIQIVGPVTGADFHTGSVMFVDDISLSTGSTGTGTPPSLTIQRDGNSLVVSWPADATGFALQTSNRISPAQWTNVPGLGASHSYKFTPASQAYFRLIKTGA